MAAINPILTPDRGKAHTVALAVLCVLAGVQAAAMIRAVWLAKSRSLAAPDVAAAAAMPVPEAQPPGAPPLPASARVVPKLMPPPAVPGAEAAAPAPTPSVSLVSPPAPQPSAPAAAASGPPLSAEVQEDIDTARQLRPLGDLKGALDVLQHADSLMPDHPKVLTEIAQTYQMMGLTDQAAATRQQLAAARARAGGAAPDPAAAPGESLPASTGLTTPDAGVQDAAQVLGIGKCEVIRDRPATRGERVTLRLPIRSRPGEEIDPAAIDIEVFFFDLVNGERVEQTKADVPVNTWVDAPVDWKQGMERLDVLYSMPDMTPEMLRSVGRRQFHGYIAKLYYRHQLQDTVMEPASLRSFGTGGGPRTTGQPAPQRAGR